MNYSPSKDKYPILGLDKCEGPRPSILAGSGYMFCFWKRSVSGTATIYLYADEKVAYRSGPTVERAFGWISKEKSELINTDGAESGWAVYKPALKTVIIVSHGVGSAKPLNWEALLHGSGGLDYEKQRTHWKAWHPVNPYQTTYEDDSMGAPTKDLDSFAKPQSPLPKRSNPEMASKLETAVTNITVLNKNAAVRAAYLEAGNLANKQLSKASAKALPVVLRGYANTALGRIVIANIATMALQHLRPGNDQLTKLGEAMTIAAYQELIQQFDIDGMIEEFLSSKDVKAALRKLGSKENE